MQWHCYQYTHLATVTSIIRNLCPPLSCQRQVWMSMLTCSLTEQVSGKIFQKLATSLEKYTWWLTPRSPTAVPLLSWGRSPNSKVEKLHPQITRKFPHRWGYLFVIASLIYESFPYRQETNSQNSYFAFCSATCSQLSDICCMKIITFMVVLITPLLGTFQQSVIYMSRCL